MRLLRGCFSSACSANGSGLATINPSLASWLQSLGLCHDGIMTAKVFLKTSCEKSWIWWCSICKKEFATSPVELESRASDLGSISRKRTQMPLLALSVRASAEQFRGA
jgi:hypothetical protein